MDHIRALAFISEQTAIAMAQADRDAPDRVMATQIGEALNIPPSKAQAYCDQMIRFGVLRDWSLGEYGYKPGSYAITEYGRELIRFLQEHS